MARCLQSDGLCHDACLHITGALRCGLLLNRLVRGHGSPKNALVGFYKLSVIVDPTNNWGPDMAWTFGVFV